MNSRFAFIVAGICLGPIGLASGHAQVAAKSGSAGRLPGGVRSGRTGGTRPVGVLSTLDLYKRNRYQAHQTAKDFISQVQNGPVGLSLSYKRAKTVRIHTTIARPDDQSNDSAKNFVDTMTGSNSSPSQIPHDIWWSSGTFDTWYTKTVYSTKDRNSLERKLASEQALRRYSEAQNFDLQNQFTKLTPYEYGTGVDTVIDKVGGKGDRTSNHNPRDIYGYSRVNPFSGSKGKADPYASVRSGFFSSKPTRH